MKKQILALFLAFFAFFYSVNASAQIAASTAAYELFMANVTTWTGSTVSFASTGVPLVSSASPIFTASTFAGGGTAVSSAAEVAVGVSRAAVVVEGVATGANVFAAVRTLAMGPVGIGLTALIAAPLIQSYFTNDRVSLKSGAEATDKPFTLLKDEVQTGTLYRIGQGTWYPSKASACSAMEAAVHDAWITGYAVSSSDPKCVITVTSQWETHEFGSYNYNTMEGTVINKVAYPASWNDILPYMDKPTSPAVFKALIDAGAKIQVTPRSSTGPAEVVHPATKTRTETPEKITETTTTPKTKLEYSTKTDPVTGQAVPVVKATPSTTTTVMETDKATGVTTPISTTTTEAPKVETPKEDLGSISDTPFGDIPKLYERKYPDGIKGVWDESIVRLKMSPLFRLVDTLMPANIPTSGSCPAFMIPLNLGQWGEFGNLDFSPPCFVWSIAKLIILISAFLLARRLIFGG